ncbi:MAG: Gfo/Idh/MocA family oxidoreductase [Eubacteriales bacterium]|nr:Gfo/Idh/MocA family oxidoreductase [Eubacteriales bacterium]
MVRIATIGTNFITRWFMEALQHCDDAVCAAVYSRKEETARAFAAEYGVATCYTDLEALASAPDIDAVYIASPNSLHCQQAILMMEHGKHVLCEKTIASNSAELAHMLETAKKNHVVCLEAMRSVFDPGFAAIEDNLPKLGKVRRVSFQYGKYSSRYDKFKAGIVENAFDPAFSNGALMDIGVYCVHPLVKLFGMPERIMADALKLENGVDGAGTILASYGHMQAELLYSKITDNRLPSQIQGEEATMLIEDIPHPCELTICYRDGRKEVLAVEKEGASNMIYEIRIWVELIEHGGDPEQYNAASVMELQVMDEVRRQTGIRFPADEEERWII